MMMNSKSIGLYIHIPFCYSKCPYCDFFSIVTDDKMLVKDYLKALKKEIEIYSQKIYRQRISSLYLGGGTPTLLSGHQIVEILELCFRHFDMEKVIEITVESNPATFEMEKARILRQSGVNRLSLGAQSFNDRMLKKIGRIHNRRDIFHSFQIAREAGFENINIDIMFGLPGQTCRQFEKTLEELIILHPEHISVYALTIEPDTPFDYLLKRGIIHIPSDEIAHSMYWNAITHLKKNGYEHYEISNFALPEKRCMHNQIYWKNRDYLGLGASSTSYIENKRYKNISQPDQYIYLLENDLLPVESKEVLPLKEKMAETVILQLRMMDGLDKQDFIRQFHTPVEALFSQQLESLIRQGLLQASQFHYYLTDRGISLANHVFMEFLD